ncbi:helix-turn-helix domain-containing protein [Epibacterium sp. SM1979]|uniref:Helix-turn-helix domain-containing protein n=2 Tax=Tritonibacter litoralis TaxID=2662264 RepID=A0A843YK95_9RHOB|nr:helix-turn-helix domain-containing protein [Tritonibacter litoralis]
MQLREIAFATGFRSASHFTAAFKNQFGCTPQQFPKGQHRLMIRPLCSGV